MKKDRIFGLDLVRTIAILLVVIVHVFMMNYFQISTINGIESFILLFIKNIAMTCVPLFILLTGYLKSNKKIDVNHYKSLKNILITYLFIAVITIIFDILYLKNSFNFYKHIVGIFNFSINEYAWYIEMYIGLFLLIPFLNVLYHNLKSKKQKRLLIITLLFLSSIPYTINNIKILNKNLDILPMYWYYLYIIAYYYIGMYIKEYKPRINKIINILLIIIVVIIQTIGIYLIVYNKQIEGNILLDYNSIFTFIISILIFILFYDIHSDKYFINKTIEIISNTSLELYLFSYIFDKIIYDYTNRGIININSNCFKSFITNVPIVFVLSFVAGTITRYIIKIKEVLYEEKNF